MMSPFFKPTPRKSKCFVIYQSLIYWFLAGLGVLTVITLPWLITFTRDFLTEATPTLGSNEPLVDGTWVYATVAVIIVIIASVLFLGTFAIYSESFRFCMAFGCVAIFSPMVIVHYWRYVYAVTVMVAEEMLGIMFIVYAVLVIRYENEMARRLDGTGRTI